MKLTNRLPLVLPLLPICLLVPLLNHTENFILPYPGAGVAIGYGLDSRSVEVRVPVGARFFSHLTVIQIGSGAHPVPFLFSGYWGLFPRGVKWPGHEADHLPPTSAELRNTWIYTSTPHTSSWRSTSLIKYRDSYTFLHLSCPVCDSGCSFFALSILVFFLCFYS
jgi:hypothetical protein